MPTAPPPETGALPEHRPLVGGDPVTVVAIALIAASVLARAVIARRGYLSYDDFPLISMADANGLTPGYLLGLFNNHLMPGGHLVTWLTHRLAGFGYTPYLLLLTTAQALTSVVFYRLLRLMLAPGWTLLVPLTVFLFSPLTLEASSWWAVGVNMLPMQLAMILAVGAQLKYIRSGRPRHLVTLALSVLLGLLFFEKALLTVALVFLVTVCLYTRGGPLRSVVTAVRTWWPAWLVLTGISLTFLAVYLTRSASSLRRPASVDEVVTFLTQLFGHTLVPGLIGGPWSWLGAGDGAPITAPSLIARWVSLAVVLGFAGYTVWRRGRAAARAWVLLLLYAALVAGLLGATRLGSVYSAVAGAVPRYLADVTVVAALAAGAALCGLRREEPAAATETAGAAAPRAAGRLAVPALAGGLAVLLASSMVTAVRFGEDWAVKAGRDYLAAARADLATAPPGTAFMDQPVPEIVVGRLSAPYNLQSRFFAPLDEDPAFVTQARNLSVFDDTGHIRPAWIDGVPARPGPEPGCGHKVTTGPARIALRSGVEDYWHVVRIGYISNRDTAATLRIGSGEARPFDVHRGLNAAFLLVRGGGATVEMTVTGPAATICTDEIAVGKLVPAPAG
ncbi:MAG TPA: hypothetical protein VFH03_06030 [Actinoplanes sp.]|nr:hypothetical protein [Actinoplanes sp.]